MVILLFFGLSSFIFRIGLRLSILIKKDEEYEINKMLECNRNMFMKSISNIDYSSSNNITLDNKERTRNYSSNSIEKVHPNSTEKVHSSIIEKVLKNSNSNSSFTNFNRKASFLPSKLIDLHYKLEVSNSNDDNITNTYNIL